MRILHLLKDMEPGGIQSLLMDTFASRHLFPGELGLFAMGYGRFAGELERLADPLFWNTSRRFPVDWSVVKKLRRVIEHYQPDLLHTHHFAELLHAALALRGNRKVRLAHTVHVSPHRIRMPERLLFKMFGRYAHLLLVPSLALQQELVDHGFPHAHRFQVVHNGVLASRVLPPYSKEKCRKVLELPQDHFIIGMAGSFYNRIRDQKTLCRAFSQMKTQKIPVSLAMAGAEQSVYFKNNREQEACKTIIRKGNKENNTFFLPNIHPAGIFYGALDLYVHSSRHDTFGLAPAEALINNLPVILSKIPPFIQLFQQYPQVKMFPAGNHQTLAEQMEEAVKEHNDQPRDEKPNDQALKNLGMEKHWENMEKMYNMII